MKRQMGQGSTYLGNQAQFNSRGNITNYGNGDININQQNNEALMAAINALKEINLKTIEAQKEVKVINNFPKNTRNNFTKHRHVKQEKGKDIDFEEKRLNPGLAFIILVLNLLWPGAGTIVGALNFESTDLVTHYLVAGFAQIGMGFILIGWCFAFMTSLFLLRMANNDMDPYEYQMNNHSGNCAY